MALTLDVISQTLSPACYPAAPPGSVLAQRHLPQLLSARDNGYCQCKGVLHTVAFCSPPRGNRRVYCMTEVHSAQHILPVVCGGGYFWGSGGYQEAMT